MLTDILILISAAIAAGAVLYLSIFLLNHMRTPTEETKRIEKQIDDFPRLPLQNEGAFGTKPINNNAVIIKTAGIKSTSEVLNMIEGVDKGILTVNEAREISGLRPVKGDPFVEFQTSAQRFGIHINKQNGDESVGGSTIRRASNCPNCGSNLTQNGVCAYCGTTYN